VFALSTLTRDYSAHVALAGRRRIRDSSVLSATLGFP
jgi:hypothetical protein